MTCKRIEIPKCTHKNRTVIIIIMLALNQNLANIKNSSPLTFYIVKYKYSVNQLRDISRVHFTKNRRLFTSWWPV